MRILLCVIAFVILGIVVFGAVVILPIGVVDGLYGLKPLNPDCVCEAWHDASGQDRSFPPNAQVRRCQLTRWLHDFAFNQYSYVDDDGQPARYQKDFVHSVNPSRMGLFIASVVVIGCCLLFLIWQSVARRRAMSK
jgi:hypothetical protein